MPKLIPLEKIENKILLIRGEKVMLDKDLADFYGVETKVFNQAVKRNIERFPDDFMFQLTVYEAEYLEKEEVINPNLRSQIVTSRRKNNEDSQSLRSQNATSSWGGRRYCPYVFTEQGVAMLSSVLRSKKAIEVNILIMRSFVKIRKLVYSYKELADKIRKIEKEQNKKFTEIFPDNFIFRLTLKKVSEVVTICDHLT